MQIKISRRRHMAFTPPKYTYTGESVLTDEGNGNWHIKFLTSGELTFNEIKNDVIDVFCVGGGGGGSGRYVYCEGAGGGGGYTSTRKSIAVISNAPYDIIVGSGGSGGPLNTEGGTGGTGGTSFAFGVSAEGGRGGKGGRSYSTGGRGGSGGGAWAASGGVDGADGGSNTTQYGTGTGGKGQGTTTREFGETDNNLYSTGGGRSNTTVAVGSNTGNGGDGRPANASTNRAGLAGGSGIVIIRNAR